MLELPESYTIANQINEVLKGKKIDEVEVGHTPHKFAFYKGQKEKYRTMLQGQTVQGAVSHGGMIEFRTEESMIFLADGAYPRYYEEKNKIPPKHQFMLGFEDGTALAVSIQMYGEIGVFPLGQCDDGYYISSSRKPGPLSETFTYDYFKGLYQEKKKMTAKLFLATEQRIPGLGNGVLQDVLWHAGIDPRYEMSRLEEKDFRNLYKAVKDTLSDMCLAGGRDTEKDLFGNKGGYRTKLSKNTLGQSCERCGNEIHKANYMGGTIYFCEHCQRR